jgi:hypothetical protein
MLVDDGAGANRGRMASLSDYAVTSEHPYRANTIHVTALDTQGQK